MKSKVIVFVNRKGGVGKTTATFNLGHQLRREGKTVLFVDLDSQANLSMLCGVPPNTLPEFKALKLSPVGDGMQVLAASKAFTALESEIDQRFNRNSYLKEEVLAKLDGLADYILVDTAPSLSILNVNALCVADIALVTVNPDSFSLAGLKEVKFMIERVKEVNPGIRYKVVLNAYFKGRKLTDSGRTALQRDEGWCGVEIPHRQHVTTANALRKAAIDDAEIGQAFEVLARVVV